MTKSFSLFYLDLDVSNSGSYSYSYLGSSTYIWYNIFNFNSCSIKDILVNNISIIYKWILLVYLKFS